jgi:hypothetical protein
MRLLRTVPLLLLIVTAVLAQNPPVSVSVDAQAGRHPINPNIYGLVSGTKNDLAATNFTINRGGGNGTSTYNWQINAANRASDWYFESVPDSSQTSGYDAFVRQTRAANGAQPLLTIPMINYLAKVDPSGRMLWSYSIAKYGPQTGSDPYNPDAGNGISAATGRPIAGNDPLDAHTPNSVSIQQAWVQQLISTWGLAASGGIQFYIMDNEPSLWSRTHRDIHPDPQTYNEVLSDYVKYAGAVRALDPNAMIVGPEEWSWWAMFLSGHDQQNGISGPGSDYKTHSQTYYYPWLLQQLYAHQQSTGQQLLNVLSTHYYPMELTNPNDDSFAGQLTRNQSTRALWDPNYVDPSWFSQVGVNGGIVNLIPTLKSWVDQYYPGLQTAVTGYNWGDETNLNGATTQADVLGIFGREGLDLATRTVPVNPSPTYLAMQLYRNYDGNLSTFGDTSISAAVENPDNVSSFAAVRSSDGALTVMVINKQQGTTPVTVNLANFETDGMARAWQVASATQTAITELGSVPITDHTITATLPSQSITLFVISPQAVTSAPAAPNGLQATVASGSVSLTWNASAGATSYTVSRGTVHGGRYVNVGSVTNTSPDFLNLQPWGRVPYSDTGLTNGTTYYYVVSGTNTAGTSPNSVELAVTPIQPPTFSSSASASPSPSTQGTSTTIQATVTCTTNGMTNGSIQVRVLDPNGEPVATQNFSSQSFTAQQSHTYSLTLMPATAGTYTVQAGVFGATGQLWNWNPSAGTVTVNSSVAFTSSATASSTLVPGETAAISVTVTETGAGGLTKGNVELQILNPTGSPVATRIWSAQNFTTGQSLPYSYSWSPIRTMAAGTYSVQIGVLDANSTHYYHLNTDATITLTGPAPAASITATAGTPQSTAVSTAFAAALQAIVKDASGNPVSGAKVTFTAPSTGAGASFGTSATATTVTDTTGQAIAPPLKANSTVGSYAVTASVAGATATASFSLTNTAGAPASITATAGTPQSAVSNTAFTAALQATVKDTGGNPLSGVTVTFTTPSMGASALFGTSATATAVTNSSGQATTPTLTANSTLGTYVVTANVTGVTAAAGFNLTNTAGASASITSTAGTPQNAAVSTAFTTALQATVKDAGGNPVSGVTVTFTAPATGASALFGTSTTATAVTDSSGQATAPTLTANSTPGTYTVTASVAGMLPIAGFSLTNAASALGSTTTTDSVTPSSGAGTNQSFAFKYSSTNGSTYLNSVYALISGGLSGVGACYAIYYPSLNALYLDNDTGTAWIGPLAPGAAGTLQNSQCIINMATTTAIGGGNTLTLTLAVSFKASFVGTKTVFGYAYDNGGLNSKWQTLGTWTPSMAVNMPPTADSVTPSSGSGLNQSFAFKYSSANGYNYLNEVLALINGGLSASGGCYVAYFPGSNALYLDSDTGPAWIGPLTPGTAGTLQNSECTINGATTTAVGSGNTLTLTLSVSFKASFAGTQTLFGYAYDNAGLSSDWQTLGTWTSH